MNPSELRHRVTIQARPVNVDGTPVRDAYGQGSQEWADVMSVWASIEPVRSQEQTAGEAVLDSRTVRFTLRYRSWITAKHRLVYAGVAYEVESVADVDERHFWTEIVATRGLTQG